MDEYVHRQYLKEEDFLETHYETVDGLLPAIGHACKPNYQCNEQVRQRRSRLFATGQATDLMFDSAVLFHNRDGLSSIRIYLHSSETLLVVRIHWEEGETLVEIVADSEC